MSNFPYKRACLPQWSNWEKCRGDVSSRVLQGHLVAVSLATRSGHGSWGVTALVPLSDSEIWRGRLPGLRVVAVWDRLTVPWREARGHPPWQRSVPAPGPWEPKVWSQSRSPSLGGEFLKIVLCIRQVFEMITRCPLPGPN